DPRPRAHVQDAGTGRHAGKRDEIARRLCEARGMHAFVDRRRSVIGAPVVHGPEGYRRSPDTLGGHVEGAPVNGFAGVLAVVLAEIVAGASVLTWASRLWHEAKRSFFS